MYSLIINQLPYAFIMPTRQDHNVIGREREVGVCPGQRILKFPLPLQFLVCIFRLLRCTEEGASGSAQHSFVAGRHFAILRREFDVEASLFEYFPWVGSL